MDPSTAGRVPPGRHPFDDAYPRLWSRRRGLEWAAAAEGRPGDHSVEDRALYAAAAASASAAPVPGDPDASLRERIRRRVLVDHHPEVARLRDRLDDRGAYGALPSHPSLLDRRRLAGAMEPDLVHLIELRASLARELGAASYGHLAMAAEGLELDAVWATMTDLRAATLDAARALVTGPGTTVETWFDVLGRRAGPIDIDAVAAARTLTSQLGCDALLKRVRWHVDDGPIAGWAVAQSIPDDVRVLVRPARSLADLVTVFHELGHVLAYAGTRADGIRAVPSDTQDETMGAVMEHIAARLALDDGQRARLRRIGAAETARVATSSLFEIAIEADPRRARELFETWYAPLVAVPDPVVWALDTFRAVDPYRIHAYAIGARFGKALVSRLETDLGEETVRWGRWLRDVLWAPGRRDTFADLAALLGDRARTALPHIVAG